MRFGELFPRIEYILLKADYLHHCHLEIETETSIVMTNPGSDEVKGLDSVKEEEANGDNSHLKNLFQASLHTPPLSFGNINYEQDVR